MRTDARLLAIMVLLALPVAGFTMGNGKGKPQPIPCPTTDVGTALATECPCAGKTDPNSTDPNSPAAGWRNHGQYVKCVVHYRNALRKAGCLTGDARRTLARCAARSTCGKRTATLCCHYDLGTCPAGTCSNDPNGTCQTAANCTKSGARIVRDPNSCTAGGDVVVVGGGSVCDSCPPPPAP